VAATPGSRRGKSRWDETPAGPGMMGGATPGIGATPMMGGATPLATPMGGMDMPTPSPSNLPKQALTAEQHQVGSLSCAGIDMCSEVQLVRLGFVCVLSLSSFGLESSRFEAQAVVARSLLCSTVLRLVILSLNFIPTPRYPCWHPG